MKNEYLIIQLSTDLWDKTSFDPNAKNILPFWDRLKELNVSDFIVYNFLNYQGTYLESLILSTFNLWKNLEILDWKNIFKRLEGNLLAEYYMKTIADRILGIDPGYKSTTNLQISAITFPDNVLHNASNFIPNTVGKLKEIHKRKLIEKYDLSFEDLIQVHLRLIK